MRITGKRTQPFLLAAALLLLAARSEAAPAVPSCSKPDWPAEARRYELEGTTTLRVVVGDDGRPTSASVEKSSGWRLLDKASLEGLSRCVFPKSASDGNAKPAQFVWRFGGEPLLHPSLVDGSCPQSERFQAFKSLDKSPSDANGILLRMLVKSDARPGNSGYLSTRFWHFDQYHGIAGLAFITAIPYRLRSVGTLMRHKGHPYARASIQQVSGRLRFKPSPRWS
jgi:TonB family protein